MKGSELWENGEEGESKIIARRRARETTRMVNKGFTDKATIFGVRNKTYTYRYRVCAAKARLDVKEASLFVEFFLVQEEFVVNSRIDNYFIIIIIF